MIAIETKGKFDKKGRFTFTKPVRIKGKDVKVILLVEEEELDEKSWVTALSKNPVFDFLKSEKETYSMTDGKPFNG
jgi:hypothetical protein